MKKIKVLSLMKVKKQNAWAGIGDYWNKYFEVEHIIDTPANLDKYRNKGIDILFIQDASKDFHVGDYHDFQSKNERFKYIVVKEQVETTDFEIYKRLADSIIYMDIRKIAIWKSIALLRRYWNTHSKRTTIIHKDIIADFIENQVSLNGKLISLTTKEIKLLRFFLENIGDFNKKDDIFHEVWKVDDKDTTRVVDQILFKLKKKIGEKYFTISRQKGIKFE